MEKTKNIMVYMYVWLVYMYTMVYMKIQVEFHSLNYFLIWKLFKELILIRPTRKVGSNVKKGFARTTPT